MWPGGVFKKLDNGGLCYMNGQGRTFIVDPNELCSFYLVELVKKCPRYDGRIQGFLYLVPGLGMVDALRRVTDDESMREMIQVAEKHKGVEVYAMHARPTPSSIAASNTNNDPIKNYEWEDSRPDSPIPISVLILDFSSDSDTADPSYNPQVDKGKAVSRHPFFGKVYIDDSEEEDVLDAKLEGGADLVAPQTATAAAPQPTPTYVQATLATPSSSQQIDTTHHSLTAQPTILGRGGKTILMGRESTGRKGRGGAAANAGRGRGINVLDSVGVFIASDRSALTSTQANKKEARSAMDWFQCSQESQSSTLHQPTQ
uniref:PB1-like domain-containing protein n=1 Tax=Chenopodium quinoa TaxID=63459 RepID=A0A803MD91_CHEQI